MVLFNLNDEEENKLNSTIIRGVHALADDAKKGQFNLNNLVTI